MKISLKDHKFRKTIIMTYVILQSFIQFLFPAVIEMWYLWLPFLLFVFYLFYLEYENNLNSN